VDVSVALDEHSSSSSSSVARIDQTKSARLLCESERLILSAAVLKCTNSDGSTAVPTSSELQPHPSSSSFNHLHIHHPE